MSGIEHSISGVAALRPLLFAAQAVLAAWLRRLKRGRRYNADMRKSNVALRLQASLLEEAKKVSQAEGVALNQFINVAVAEKLSALRTEDYFRERASRADLVKVRSIVKRAGKGKAPVAGDEIE
jgi:hypothetical protein